MAEYTGINKALCLLQVLGDTVGDEYEYAFFDICSDHSGAFYVKPPENYYQPEVVFGFWDDNDLHYKMFQLCQQKGVWDTLEQELD